MPGTHEKPGPHKIVRSRSFYSFGIDKGGPMAPFALFRLFRLAAEALCYPVPLGLRGHGPTDKRRDRLSGLLSGLLGRYQRFRGKG